MSQIVPDDANEVREMCRHSVALPSRVLMVETQRQYRLLQIEVSAHFRRACDSGLAEQPPCTKCPVDVFYYCETTGTECKIFRIYSSGGVRKGGRRAND